MNTIAGPNVGLALPPTALAHSTDLPFVEFEKNLSAQLLHVDLDIGLWVTRVHLQPGYKSKTHRHLGTVLSFTSTGRWHYLESPGTCVAGTYLYERVGAIHTQHVFESNTEITDVLFAVYGNNEDLDEDGNVVSVYGAKQIMKLYLRQCEEARLPRPNFIGA